MWVIDLLKKLDSYFTPEPIDLKDADTFNIVQKLGFLDNNSGARPYRDSTDVIKAFYPNGFYFSDVSKWPSWASNLVQRGIVSMDHAKGCYVFSDRSGVNFYLRDNSTLIMQKSGNITVGGY